MREIEWDGIKYLVNAQDAYDIQAMILLPTGRLLEVGGWLETMPPIPVDMKAVPVIVAVKKE